MFLLSFWYSLNLFYENILIKCNNICKASKIVDFFISSTGGSDGGFKAAGHRRVRGPACFSNNSLIIN